MVKFNEFDHPLLDAPPLWLVIGNGTTLYSDHESVSQ